jgi:predicted RNA-binding protein with PUA-like domain
MAKWLFKTEPSDYSFDDLLREGKTVWDGVRNNWALKNLSSIKNGDDVFIYHTGKEKKIVGIAQVISEPYPDPRYSDEKLLVIDIKAVKQFSQHISLKMLKNDPLFSDFMLVKFTRLSILAVNDKYWKKIVQLSQS